MAASSAPFTCPICRKDVSIQRVPALVAGGTSTGVFSGPSGGVVRLGNETGTYGGYTTLRGTSATDLARALQLEPMPKLPTVYSKGYAIFIGILSFVGGAATLGLGWLAAIFSLMFLSSQGPIVVGDPKAAFAKYAASLATWKLARTYWASLYYCHQDGIVFDPQTHEQCQPEATRAFVAGHIQPAPVERFGAALDVFKAATRTNPFTARSTGAASIEKLVDQVLRDLPPG